MSMSSSRVRPIRLPPTREQRSSSHASSSTMLGSSIGGSEVRSSVAKVDIAAAAAAAGDDDNGQCALAIITQAGAALRAGTAWRSALDVGVTDRSAVCSSMVKSPPPYDPHHVPAIIDDALVAAVRHLGAVHVNGDIDAVVVTDALMAIADACRGPAVELFELSLEKIVWLAEAYQATAQYLVLTGTGVAWLAAILMSRGEKNGRRRPAGWRISSRKRTKSRVQAAATRTLALSICAASFAKAGSTVHGALPSALVEALTHRVVEALVEQQEVPQSGRDDDHHDGEEHGDGGRIHASSGNSDSSSDEDSVIGELGERKKKQGDGAHPSAALALVGMLEHHAHGCVSALAHSSPQITQLREALLRTLRKFIAAGDGAAFSASYRLEQNREISHPTNLHLPLLSLRACHALAAADSGWRRALFHQGDAENDTVAAASQHANHILRIVFSTINTAAGVRDASHADVTLLTHVLIYVRLAFRQGHHMTRPSPSVSVLANVTLSGESEMTSWIGPAVIHMQDLIRSMLDGLVEHCCHPGSCSVPVLTVIYRLLTIFLGPMYLFRWTHAFSDASEVPEEEVFRPSPLSLLIADVLLSRPAVLASLRRRVTIVLDSPHVEIGAVRLALSATRLLRALITVIFVEGGHGESASSKALAFCHEPETLRMLVRGITAFKPNYTGQASARDCRMVWYIEMVRLASVAVRHSPMSFAAVFAAALGLPSSLSQLISAPTYHHDDDRSFDTMMRVALLDLITLLGERSSEVAKYISLLSCDASVVALIGEALSCNFMERCPEQVANGGVEEAIVDSLLETLSLVRRLLCSRDQAKSGKEDDHVANMSRMHQSSVWNRSGASSRGVMDSRNRLSLQSFTKSSGVHNATAQVTKNYAANTAPVLEMWRKGWLDGRNGFRLLQSFSDSVCSRRFERMGYMWEAKVAQFTARLLSQQVSALQDHANRCDASHAVALECLQADLTTATARYHEYRGRIERNLKARDVAQSHLAERHDALLARMNEEQKRGRLAQTRFETHTGVVRDRHAQEVAALTDKSLKLADELENEKRGRAEAEVRASGLEQRFEEMAQVLSASLEKVAVLQKQCEHERGLRVEHEQAAKQVASQLKALQEKLKDRTRNWNEEREALLRDAGQCSALRVARKRIARELKSAQERAEGAERSVSDQAETIKALELKYREAEKEHKRSLQMRVEDVCIRMQKDMDARERELQSVFEAEKTTAEATIAECRAQLSASTAARHEAQRRLEAMTNDSAVLEGELTETRARNAALVLSCRTLADETKRCKDMVCKSEESIVQLQKRNAEFEEVMARQRQMAASIVELSTGNGVSPHDSSASNVSGRWTSQSHGGRSAIGSISDNSLLGSVLANGSSASISGRPDNEAATTLIQRVMMDSSRDHT